MLRMAAETKRDGIIAPVQEDWKKTKYLPGKNLNSDIEYIT
jgi:hypothetical protein